MKSIILVVPFFGKLPCYFNLWLKSAEKNSTINFLLILDDDTSFNFPKNVKVIYSTFATIQNIIKSKFNFKVKINTPYKLCDYKPFYNIIFEEEIKNFDYWGYCDLDLIFGNIRKFITEDILNKYDKIYTRGHLTIFKNDENINKIISYKKISKNYYNFQEAYSTNYVCHFDEWGGVSKIFKFLNILQYDEIDFADLNMKKFNFQLLFINLKNKKGIFEWNNGTLNLIDKKMVKHELIYAHFQKRNMENCIKKSKIDKFIIIPNKFIDFIEINKDFVNKNTKNKLIYFYYFKRRVNTIKYNLKNDAIKQRLYRLIKRLKYIR